MGSHVPLKSAPSYEGSGPIQNKEPWAQMSMASWSVQLFFAQLTHVPNKHTHRPCYLWHVYERGHIYAPLEIRPIILKLWYCGTRSLDSTGYNYSLHSAMHWTVHGAAFNNCHCYTTTTCPQCFDAVGWAAGRASNLQKKLSWVEGCWCGYLSGARCRLAHGLADATATQCLLLQ